MSFLEKLHALIDPTLKDAFDKRPYDPASDRAWVVGRLEAAKTQFASTESTRGGGKRWWQLNNGIVAFSPTRRDKSPLVINGQTTNFIPAERFNDAIATMIAAVNAGDFDKEFAADNTNGTTVKVRLPRKAKEPSEAGGGKGWSDERRAKFAATVAARKAG